MAYSAPTTITTGQLVTASLMNTDWGGNIAFLANPPACRAYNNANQSITDSVVTSIALNSERYDTDTMHNNVTNNSRITINTAGLYVISGTITWAAGGTSGARFAGLWVSGATKIAENAVITNAAVPVNVGTIYKLSAGQYVEMYGYQVSGGALNSLAAANISAELSATWIGLG